MFYNWWTPKGLVFAAALACVVAMAGIGLAYPQPVSNAALGPEWQCSRLAFVWTTCRRPKHAEAVSIRLVGEPACRRLRA